MKKSLMNIKHFVDSNVRQRIDRAANNNSDFFDEDLVQVERQFEDIRQICIDTEKRISIMLQSIQLAPSSLGTYSQNVQAGLNNLSHLTSSSTNTSAISGSIGTSVQYNSKSNTSSIKLTNSDHDALGGNGRSSKSTSSMSHFDSNLLLSTGSSQTIPTDPNELRDDIQRHKKLPIIGFLKFLVKSRHKLKPDSLLATTFKHCSHLQTQLTKLYLNYEQTIDTQCLKPIQQVLEVDIPNVVKLRKLFIKSHNDLESVRAKYNGASQKQLQSQQTQAQASHSTSTSYTITQSGGVSSSGFHQTTSTSKLDQLRRELEEAMSKCDQTRDTYAAELYSFVCRECELVNLFQKFYQYQAKYHQQVGQVIESSLPSLSNALVSTRRKVVFGSPLNEHLRCTGLQISPVIELSIHLLHSKGLNEEGLFRIPGSSMKIKKLKNAINAWFVTLASQSELEVESQSPASSPCLLAVYSMFREILGQPQVSNAQHLQDYNNEQVTTIDSQLQQQQQQSFGTLQTTTQSGGGSANSIAASESTHSSGGHHHHQFAAHHAVCSSSSSAYNQAQQQNSKNLIYDLHSIAGLLKLYLRELPEHLFTYALYDNWIEATTTTTTSPLRPTDLDARLVLYESLLKQLPRSNYENLRHLIRFLHVLTCHRELNKMTATNLAIAMAPSLIWTKPVTMTTQQMDNVPSNIGQLSQNREHQQQNNDELFNASQQQQHQQAATSLSMQMSSVGMSASLHVLVIETLISQAERLFPGQVQLTLPAFAKMDEQETPISRNSNSKGSASESSHQQQQSNNSRSSSSIGHFNRDSPSLSMTSSSQRGFGRIVATGAGTGGDVYACGGGSDIRANTKSNSPTGLSTASSSSFSSTSNGSFSGGYNNNKSDVASTDGADHLQRKPPLSQHYHHYAYDKQRGGSMEGTLSKDDITTKMGSSKPPAPASGASHRVTLTRGRPVSVHIPTSTGLLGRSAMGEQQHPPPVPPAPVLRRQLTSSNKPPAPPVPNQLSRQPAQQLSSPTTRTTAKINDDDLSSCTETSTMPRAPSRGSKANELQPPLEGSSSGSGGRDTTRSSLRGTVASAKRPTVPPPERPMKSQQVESTADGGTTIAATTGPSNNRSQSIELDSDSKSGQSISSSGRIRGDFVETNSDEVDGEISVSVSPVASLDSISAVGEDDDSSFNADEDDDDRQDIDSPVSPVDNHHIGHGPSWIADKPSLPPPINQNTHHQRMTTTEALSSTETATTNKSKPIISDKRNVIKLSNQQRPSAGGCEDKTKEREKGDVLTSGSGSGNGDELKVPVKPPRTMSPKLIHSTPL